MSKYKLDLQLFAEGDGDGTGDGSGAGAEGASGNNQGGEGSKETRSFDDFLAQEGNQAEFDRRVQKAVNAAVGNAQAKWKALSDDKLSEAEKLAKMTKEEKAEYRARKLEKELNDMKKQNALSEMAKTARKMLSEEEISIPDELLSHLVSEEAEDTKASVEAFVKLYKKAVEDGVKEAVKGRTPKNGAGGSTITKEQILQIKDPGKRQQMIAEHMDLFR